MLTACADELLNGTILSWTDETCLTVVMAAKGYPGSYEKGTAIRNLNAANAVEGAEVFHAGTKADGDTIAAVGGRVLGVTALGDNVTEAQSRAYEALGGVDWDGAFYRRDIAYRAVAREQIHKNE